MGTKKTAVEWAFAMLGKMSDEKIKLQAKQMEKEHIGRAYQEGLIDGMNHSPKDYYNETYKQQNNGK